MKTLSIKRSFTIKENVDQTLRNFENKSEVVNAALSVYFERTEYLKKAEDTFWNEKIAAGLADVKNGRFQVINPDGGKITSEKLSETLWS